MNLAEIRNDYIKLSLDVMSVGSDPIKFFFSWLEEAISAEAQEPTAMVVSSVAEDGKPSSRVVLLKGLEDDGFKFFTNYNSRKGLEIAGNPNLALLFFWPELERQVRIEGKAIRVTTGESDIYFNSRPLESRIGAIISPQSKVIDGRAELEKEFLRIAKINRLEEIVRPEYWGGYVVAPDSIEFWQGRPGRMHDRIRFRKDGKDWIREQLAP